MRAADLARDMEVHPKTLRSWLRKTFPDHQNGTDWWLDETQVELARNHFARGKSATAALAAPVQEQTPADTEAADEIVLMDKSTVDIEVLLAGLLDSRALSRWRPFFPGWKEAPRTPGVYIIRDGEASLVYVGRAGERSGKGLRDRLKMYATGRAATSGFGRHAFDRALADPEWLDERTQVLATSGPEPATEWVRAAIRRVQPHVRWVECADGREAQDLESHLIHNLRAHGLWN